MMQPSRIAERRVVLLGLGHTNAHVLRMWGMQRPPKTELVCVSNYSIATYSGMLPAVLAGQIPPSQMEIDLVRLCNSVGARLITDPVMRLAPSDRTLHFANRPSIPFDVLSIGIGSVPTTNGVEIANDGDRRSPLLTIKPMQTFLPRLEEQLAAAIQQQMADGDRDRIELTVAVVGAGVAGVEIVMCLGPFLEAKRVELEKTGTTLHFYRTLVTRGPAILSDMADGTRQRVLGALSTQQIAVRTGSAVKSVDATGLELANGQRVDADVVIWATGASAPPMLEHLGLPLDDRGFLATNACLQSTLQDDLPIFAVGDTGAIVTDPLPKSGVYAVRQGPVLWDNVRRALHKRPLRRFVPQRTFMRLINKGDGSAIGQWRGLSFEGDWVMRWKDRIDQRFMDKFEPKVMAEDPNEPMQCRGCGCKLASEPLNAALDAYAVNGETPAEGAAARRSTIVADDAAEIGIPGGSLGNKLHESAPRLFASTDFFTLPFEDAYLAGRVAALHASSDLLAMGADVRQALGNVVLAEGRPQDQRKVLEDFLAGARREFEGLDAAIVGGHTTVGPRMEAGFTVIGAATAPLRKDALRPGDLLVVTKPLGIGVLLAAHMRSQCAARDYDRLVETMLQSSRPAAQLAVSLGVASATDVTGFGLGGHLLEMAIASQTDLVLELQQLPVLPGVESHLQRGIESSLAPSNQTWLAHAKIPTELDNSLRLKLLSDPQTCGGLVFGASESQARQLLAELPEATIVGHVEPQRGAKPAIEIRG